MLNLAPHHGGMWRNGVLHSVIPDNGYIYIYSVFGFASQPLYFQGNAFRYGLNRRLNRPKRQSGRSGGETFLPLHRNKRRSSMAPLRSLFTTPNDLFRLRGGDWKHKRKSAAYSWQEVIFQLRCRQEIPILGRTICYKMLRWASGALLWKRHTTISWLADSRSVLKDYVPKQRPDLTLTVQKVAGSNCQYLLDYSLYQWDEIYVNGKNYSKAEKQQLLNQLPKHYVASMSRSC